MSDTKSPAPAPSAAGFAHLLAALATPAARPDQEWNDETLAEDVASLSYERALRSHARYRGADPVEGAAPSAAQALDAEMADAEDFLEQSGFPAAARARAIGPEDFARAHDQAQAELARRGAERVPTALEKSLKNASITIRMSKTEAEQLHRRAAEAGLTVSAYLRSCTFEAETLRAQVKEVLAELRSASPSDRRSKENRRGLFSALADWFRRLFAPAPRSQRVARA